MVGLPMLLLPLPLVVVVVVVAGARKEVRMLAGGRNMDLGGHAEAALHVRKAVSDIAAGGSVWPAPVAVRGRDGAARRAVSVPVLTESFGLDMVWVVFGAGLPAFSAAAEAPPKSSVAIAIASKAQADTVKQNKCIASKVQACTM